MKFPATRQAYAAARDDLLARLTRHLEADPRFAAAWLIGSFGRGEQDAVSDLDLFLVVETAYSDALCLKNMMTSSTPPPERMALFSTVGYPVNIHENHHNAPPGGSFSSVLYRDPPVIVDWTLVPRPMAFQPAQSRRLFDHTPGQWHPGPLSAGQDSVVPERADPLAERLAAFWMMAAVTAKYIVRDRTEQVQELLAFVDQIWGEIRVLGGKCVEDAVPAHHPSRLGQMTRLRNLCDQVQSMENGASEPRAQVDAILDLD